ncbi:HEAT repeat domain-containing protein [Streptomyces prunicolor]|uniref:HEAT repeat domain-containing protein n=1 Tax=Streptomyces prunicolor TaxID=67348 RepID=UPI0022519BEA|nr:HEAT repeat domain-containing protein [Streptomyces prunicolor]MCX5241096.1 HEAT repeat domain-containing protein [Streptomyces prunicolor]
MFTGIDEVDWASLRHAYGSAEDVPGLLRGLASTDPVERAGALDGMYGAVHHQGIVYDSTLACVPFLFALAACEEVADRGGLVELLVGIGRGHAPEETAEAGNGPGAADAAVRAGAEVFAVLLGDRDTDVRRAAAEALVRFLDQPARVLGLLRQRITVERDDRVLFALTESVGLFVRQHPAHAPEALDILLMLGTPPYDPGLRLAALGQLAGCAPDLLPADLVPTVVELLGERSEQRRSGRLTRDDPDGPDPDTLAGLLRRLRPSDEEGALLLRTLHTALGGRVSDRIALLEGQLTSPDAADRCNGVWLSAGLFREWRADYAAPVELIGKQLDAGTRPLLGTAVSDRLRDAAVSVLGDLFHLAAPAADHLNTLVIARPDLWVQRWERRAPTLGGPLKALARSGDPRATPVLAQVLAQPVVPGDLGRVIVHLGPSAAPLAPALRHLLGRVPLDSPETYDRAVPLLSALTALADREAVPEVLRLLRGMADGVRSRPPVVESAVRALDVFGGGMEGVVPVLRGLLESECAGLAAGALWSVEGDASAVLPVLIRELAGRDAVRRRAAAEVLARLGASARVAVPGLSRLVEAECVWERTAGACALWRVTGEAEGALPVLRSAWVEHPGVRGVIAACLVDMGAAGEPLYDLVEAEIAAPRRHLVRSGGHGSQDVLEDERLLEVCREVRVG